MTQEDIHVDLQDLAVKCLHCTRSDSILLHILQQKIQVGPVSVGYRLSTEALLFGGKTLTATDIAVAAGLCSIDGGDKAKVAHLTKEYVAGTLDEIRRMVECGIDQVKVSHSKLVIIKLLVPPKKFIIVSSVNVYVSSQLSGEELPIILVGGGSIVIDKTKKLTGVSNMIYPPHYQVT